MGFILAVAGAGVGFAVIARDGAWPSGVRLIPWVVAIFTAAWPLMVLELATGAIFQASLAESCRKAQKRIEVVGWLGAALALVALVLATHAAAALVVSAYDCLLAAVGNQPLPWTANADKILAPTSSQGAVILGVAAVLALAQMRLWRGAPGLARYALYLVPFGTLALLGLAGVLIGQPGAIDGLARLLAPDDDGWRILLTPQPWITAYATVLGSWLFGLGIFAAYGSYLNRSSDVTSVAGVSVLAGGLGQVLIMAVAFMADGTLAGGGGSQGGGPRVGMASAAIANLGLPSWVQGLLAMTWFLALLAFVLPALFALVEAVTAPVVDKFHLARERVVPAVCLLVFIGASVLAISGERQPMAWLGSAFTALVALLVLAQVAVAWRAIRLDALQRHLNAYSALRVGWAWRICVLAVVPAASAGLLAGELVLATGSTAHAWLVLVIAAAVLAPVATVLARMQARGA
jgi:NSS family neurotransmitter:Na+ symporter